MWWLDSRPAKSRLIRFVLAAAAAALTAGCLQPLLADHSLNGETSIVQALRAVDVLQISAPNGSPESRLAVAVRDQVLFGLTGGDAVPPPTHRLRIALSSNNVAMIVDQVTGRTDVGNYGLIASYELTDITTGKSVLNATAATRVSFDVPGQQQRFARARGQRDAEDRAAKMIAESIRARLASYFVAGT
jgi:LPS-assembly lipoprotein